MTVKPRFVFFQENVDPVHQTEEEKGTEQQVPRRELTVEDERDIWRDITLTQYENTH